MISQNNPENVSFSTSTTDEKIWKSSVGLFDLVYLKFIHIFSFSLHRLVKSNHAETFHLKVFSLSPGGLKTWKFYYCQMWGCFCEVRRLEITVISRFAIILLLLNGRSYNSCPFVCSPKAFRGTTLPSTFSSHVARPRKLFTFVYLKFDICGPVCGNRRRTTGERAVVTKGVKNRKGSKKRARQGPRVI